MSEPLQKKITMYGTDWCPDCIRAKLVLRRLGVEFTYINTDKDPAAERRVIEHNHGARIVPTIFFPDDSALVEPSNRELTEKIICLGLAKQN
jgi:glutaredoxin